MELKTLDWKAEACASAALALLGALVVRFAVGSAGWPDVAALFVTCGLLGVLTWHVQRRRAVEELEAAALQAAEKKAESKLAQVIADVETLKPKVTKLINVVNLS